MMGFQTAPAQLFYDFCLDDHVPGDHLLRRVDRFLELEVLAGKLGRQGQPAVAPGSPARNRTFVVTPEECAWPS